MCVQVPKEARRELQILWNLEIDGCEWPCGFWKPKRGPLQEQQSVLNSRAIFAVPYFSFLKLFHCVSQKSLKLTTRVPQAPSAGTTGVQA